MPSVSRSSSRQRSGLVTPDSELADEEVDRLGQQASSDADALGDGERALVHAMCNVILDLFLFTKICFKDKFHSTFRLFGGNWKKRHHYRQMTTLLR